MLLHDSVFRLPLGLLPRAHVDMDTRVVAAAPAPVDAHGEYPFVLVNSILDGDRGCLGVGAIVEHSHLSGAFAVQSHAIVSGVPASLGRDFLVADQLVVVSCLVDAARLAAHPRLGPVVQAALPELNAVRAWSVLAVYGVSDPGRPLFMICSVLPRVCVYMDRPRGCVRG